MVASAPCSSVCVAKQVPRRARELLPGPLVSERCQLPSSNAPSRPRRSRGARQVLTPGSLNWGESNVIIGLQIAALLLLTVAMSLSLAHALEYPGKLRLDREHYVAVQTIYYPGFTYAGFAEPVAVIVLVVLLLTIPAGSGRFWLIAGALVAAALTHVLYWWRTAPVNKVWLRHEELSPAAERFFRRDFRRDPQANTDADWHRLRARWEHSHILRAVTSGVSFLLVLAAILL
ncbi:MAG: hypothetical protein JWL65_2641 [Gammaproteobacteria bacterium]|jgi:hypothetical protein|nr:hypothetical protein [Gammaproteobacteria bacterium]